MNIKRIASSVATLATVGSVLAGATFALFTDQASSQDNTFSSGNASLLIANAADPGPGPATYAESISGFSVTNVIPGSTHQKVFWLKNASAGNFAMNVTVDLGDLTGTTEGSLPDELLVKFQCDTNDDGFTDGTDYFSAEKSVTNWISNAPVSIDALGPHQNPEVNATTASDQDELLCKLIARLPSTATNDVAGETLSFDGLFDATQVAP